MFRELRRSRTLLAVLAMTAFVLVTLDHRAGRGSPFDGLRSAAAAVLGPIQAGVSGVAGSAASLASRITAPDRATARVESLQHDNAALRQQLAAARREASDSEAARLVGLGSSARFTLVPARVVGVDAGFGFSWTATLDAGRLDGVVPGLMVVTADGLAGRITASTATTATLLLLADPASRVGVRVGAAGEIGTVAGQGSGALLLRLLAADPLVRVGDEVTSFGSPGGRPFAAGAAVGRVLRVLPDSGIGRTALVTPAVRASTLDLVGVVTAAPRTAPHPVVVPPKPDPVVTLAPGSRRG